MCLSLKTFHRLFMLIHNTLTWKEETANFSNEDPTVHTHVIQFRLATWNINFTVTCLLISYCQKKVELFSIPLFKGTSALLSFIHGSVEMTTVASWESFYILSNISKPRGILCKSCLFTMLISCLTHRVSPYTVHYHGYCSALLWIFMIKM